MADSLIAGAVAGAGAGANKICASLISGAAIIAAIEGTGAEGVVAAALPRIAARLGHSTTVQFPLAWARRANRRKGTEGCGTQRRVGGAESVVAHEWLFGGAATGISRGCTIGFHFIRVVTPAIADLTAECLIKERA